MRRIRLTKSGHRLQQGMFLLLLFVIACFMGFNAHENLARRSIPIGLGFLNEPAGFDIIFSTINWQPTDVNAKAILVAALNTALVSLLAILLATLGGLALGVMRISSNWLVRNSSRMAIELIRNSPQLIQIFFIYVLFVNVLPTLRNGWSWFGVVYLNNRGLFIPAPTGTSITYLTILFLTAAASAGLYKYIAFRQDLSPKTKSFARLGVSSVAVAAVFFLTRISLKWEIPALQGFNITGGWTLQPEMLALLLGLSLYSSAFIGETVRGAIASVGRGQLEAAKSLGLSHRQTLRLVTLPQALRLILPPLTNQYATIIKSSSLGAAIAFPELFLVLGGTILNHTGQAIESMGILMGIFLCINLCVSLVMSWYARKTSMR